jgi:hypothetical protein
VQHQLLRRPCLPLPPLLLFSIRPKQLTLTAAQPSSCSRMPMLLLLPKPREKLQLLASDAETLLIWPDGSSGCCASADSPHAAAAEPAEVEGSSKGRYPLSPQHAGRWNSSDERRCGLCVLTLKRRERLSELGWSNPNNVSGKTPANPAQE